MRKTGVLIGWVLFATFSVVAPSAEISLPSQTATPGSSVAMPVSLIGGSVLSGIQFDLTYDSSAMTLGTIGGDAVRNASKILYIADIAPNIRRFIVVGYNQTPLSDGTLLTVLVNLRSNAAGGSYSLEAASTALGVAPDGSSVPVSALAGMVTVQGTSAGAVPLQSSGVLNAASFLPGPVAPGEFVTLLGSGIGPAGTVTQDKPGSVDLAGVRVLFDNIPAPLLYVSPGQINAIVPYAVSGSSTHLQITGGQMVSDLTLPVAEAAPGIFTNPSGGTGPGAILNQDYTINSVSNPAARGSVIMIFATGGGVTIPPATDGTITSSTLAALRLPVSVLIGATPADVTYAGPSPGFLAGFLQINCRVPGNLPPGSVPLSIQIGSLTSQTGVTVTLK